MVYEATAQVPSMRHAGECEAGDAGREADPKILLNSRRSSRSRPTARRIAREPHASVKGGADYAGESRQNGRFQRPHPAPPSGEQLTDRLPFAVLGGIKRPLFDIKRRHGTDAHRREN